MIQDENLKKKITIFSAKILLEEELKFVGPHEKGQKRTFSFNFKHYNLSIHVVKVSKRFSTHSHNSLV